MDENHLGIIITVVCLLVLMAASPMSGLFGNGYVVTPATDADIQGLTRVTPFVFHSGIFRLV